MTFPNTGNSNVTPNPAIHTVPASAKGPNPGLKIAKELEASAEFILEGFIGQVLIAFGGISIAGVKPFAALAAIGQALVQKANDAYTNAATAQTTADGAQSTANTANTTANTAQGNWLSLFAGIPGVSSVANLLSFLLPGTSGSGIFATLINGVAGSGNPLSSLISSLTGTASNASVASTNASAGLAGISTFLTNMFNGINRTTASAASQDDTFGAVSSQSDTVVGTAATMEQIIAALGSGNPDADDFERASLGSAWSVFSTGSGSLTIPNAHDAKWSGTGSSSEFVAVKNDKVASTDHQTSTIVLATAIPSYPFFTPLPYGGYVDLWVRCTTFGTYATRTGLRFRINGNPPYNATWSLDWISSGTASNLGSGSMSIPGAGASLAFEAGVAGNNRRFQARLNGTIITGADITEAGTVSQFGASYRSRGFGGKGNSGIGTAQGVPSLKQWTAQG